MYPGLTTGGILDRASSDSAYSTVGSPKVYFTIQPVDQLNASLLSSSCRSGTILGTFGTTTIQAGSIIAPSVPGFKPIPLPRNPAPNTVHHVPGVRGLTVELNKQVTTAGVLEVDGIYITAGSADPLARGQHLRDHDLIVSHGDRIHADRQIMAAVTPLTGTAAGKPANGHRYTGGRRPPGDSRAALPAAAATTHD